MDNIKISIIMPVFNGEQYLRATLESILCQDSQNFELIAVDDGSTDCSLEILKEYKDKISNMQIVTQPNLGVSAARNNGIKAVRGTYFCFCDSDDLLAANYISNFCKIAEKYQPDVAVCQYSTFYGNADLKPKHKSNVKTINGDFVTELTNLGLITQIWNKIYRTDLIKENEILMPVNLAYDEDMFFNWRVLLMAKTVVVTDDALYLYRMNQSGASMKYHKNLFQSYKNQYAEIEEFALMHNVPREAMKNQIYTDYINKMPGILRMTVRSKKNFIQQKREIADMISDEELQAAVYKYMEKGDLKYKEIANAIAEKRINYLLWCGFKGELRLKAARVIKNFLKRG